MPASGTATSPAGETVVLMVPTIVESLDSISAVLPTTPSAKIAANTHPAYTCSEQESEVGYV